MIKFSLSLPFNAELSENKRLAWNPRAGRMFSRSGYKDTKNKFIIAIAFAKSTAHARFDAKQRVFVSLKVYRPNEHFDASNFIKPINDAISEVIGINDNKFDGEYKGFVDKKNPRFVIELKQ